MVAVLEVVEVAIEVCPPVVVAADHISRLRIAVHFKHKKHIARLFRKSLSTTTSLSKPTRTTPVHVQ